MLNFSSQNARPYAYAAASGLLMALAFQFTVCAPVAWLALAPLFQALAAVSGSRRAVAVLALYAACFYLILNSFLLALHPLDYLGFGTLASLGLVTLGWLALTACEVAWFSALGLAYHGVLKLAARGRGRNLCAGPGGRLLLLAALWLILEWLQSLGWLGYTWGRLAVSQAAQPLLIQSAALAGSLTVSALILAVNALFSLALQKRKAGWAVFAACLFLCNLGGGALRIHLASPRNETAPTISAAVVQGTLPSMIKWEETSAEANRLQYQTQSLAAAAAGAELIVWPETSLAETIWQTRAQPGASFYEQVAAQSGATLLVGALWRDPTDTAYNALVKVEADRLTMVYGKRHLVPFGEYAPFEPLVERLLPSLTTYFSSNLTTYDATTTFDSGGARLGGLICYDSIFPALARTTVNEGAEILVLATNDSWFWGTAAMRQHFQQAQLRAVEQNRWLLRAANAGYSGVIDNFGREQASIEPRNQGYLLAQVPRLSGRTPYAYLGEVLVYGAFLLLAVYLLSALWPRSANPPR